MGDSRTSRCLLGFEDYHHQHLDFPVPTSVGLEGNALSTG